MSKEKDGNKPRQPLIEKPINSPKEVPLKEYRNFSDSPPRKPEKGTIDTGPGQHDKRNK